MLVTDLSETIWSKGKKVHLENVFKIRSKQFWNLKLLFRVSYDKNKRRYCPKSHGKRYT